MRTRSASYRTLGIISSKKAYLVTSSRILNQWHKALSLRAGQSEGDNLFLTPKYGNASHSVTSPAQALVSIDAFQVETIEASC